MSLSGFQRRRRELAKQKESEKQTLKEAETAISNYDNITKKEISELLAEKGIEHNPRDKKEVLFELLTENREEKVEVDEVEDDE